MSGLLFVTAPAADHKVINRLLLHLRDWEYDSGDRFHLVTTKDRSILEASSEAGNDIEPTIPPVPSDLSNPWRNANLQDVEAFVLELNKANGEHARNLQISIFVVVDEKGVQDKTCILGERAYDDDTEQQLDCFNKTRLPLDQAYGMWCNLDIANMDFVDWVHEDRGMDENRWWEYNGSETGAAIEMSEENYELREEAIKKLEDEGKA